MTWRESKPASGDKLSELPSVLTAQAIAFRQGIEKHSFWTDSSGASAGIPRLSLNSFGPGAARAFYDLESNLSSDVSATKPLAGRLFVAADTRRFYGYTSNTTVSLGGTQAVVYQTPTLVSDARILVQTGSASVSGSATTIAFSIAYSQAPTLQVTPLSTSNQSMYTAAILASTTTNFTALVRNQWGGGTVATTLLWRSHGTVAL